MKKKIFEVLADMKRGRLGIYDAHRKILSLSDGSELDSLDAQPPSNDTYSIVGESHACGADQSEDSEHTSDETLGKIIDSESLCVVCGKRLVKVIAWCKECMIEYNKSIAKAKES